MHTGVKRQQKVGEPATPRISKCTHMQKQSLRKDF